MNRKFTKTFMIDKRIDNLLNIAKNHGLSKSWLLRKSIEEFIKNEYPQIYKEYIEFEEKEKEEPINQ